MAKAVILHDFKPKALSLHDAVVAGFSKKQKSIPPKFFYNERGSLLFERICEQPEYYPPTIERRMLLDSALEIAALAGQGRVIIEPGAGSAAKVRLLLNALRPTAFVPMDISFNYLKTAAATLVEEYPGLTVHAVCADFTHSIPIPAEIPKGPRLFFFPGSSIGNFDGDEATHFLTNIRRALGDDGLLLIGVDTKKDEAILNAAYNDKAGVTAEFNLNLLHRIRDDLGMDCDPTRFTHNAFYNSTAGRIEMHLMSNAQQSLRLNGYRFELNAGESLHTENSYKYTTEDFLQLAAKSSLRSVRYWIDKEEMFSIYLLAAA